MANSSILGNFTDTCISPEDPKHAFLYRIKLVRVLAVGVFQ